MLVHQLVESELRQRADQLAGRHWPELSRARIKQLAKTDHLKFDGLPVNAGYRCRHLGQLSLDCPDPRQQPIPVLQLPIIHQDEAIIVINKPAGVISHARGRYWDEPSVASSLRALVARTWESPLRTGLAHRLDRATSGLMVIAKTPEDLKIIQRQFNDRTVSKTYRALVDNSPASQSLPDEGLIDRPIDRSPKAANKFRVSLNGKPAQTEWHKQPLKPKDRYLGLDLKPLTGRTHQLRVHLASLGCPIVGDKLYGGSIGPRMALHSYRLSFNHPRSGQRQTFVAPLPSSLQKEPPSS